MRLFSLDWPAPAWLDLFYDLAFAAAVLSISGAYSYDLSLGTAVWLGVAYGVLACTWLLTAEAIGSLRNGARRVDAVVVYGVLTQMGVVLLIAVVAGDPEPEAGVLFDLMLGTGLLVAVGLAYYCRVARGTRWTWLALGAVAALLGSWLIPVSWSWAVWLVALALAGASARLILSSDAVDGHRLGHRMGELTMIVIGEILVKVALSIGEKSLWYVSLLALTPLLTILGVAWWAYFTRPVAWHPQGRGGRVWFALGHLPLHVGLLGLAVGLGKLLLAPESLTGQAAIVGLLGVPLVLTGLGLLLIEVSLSRGRFRVLAVGLAAVAATQVIAVTLDAGALRTAYALAGVWLVATTAAHLRRPGVLEPSDAPVSAGQDAHA